MSRARRPGAVYRSDEWRARIAAGLQRFHALRRDSARVAPRDIVALLGSGTVPAHVAQLLGDGAAESVALIEALGGPDVVSPQRRLIIDDIARAGVVLRGELARYAQGDAEAGPRVGTLAAVRRAGLQALGLDARHDVIDVNGPVVVEWSEPPPETER